MISSMTMTMSAIVTEATNKRFYSDDEVVVQHFAQGATVTYVGVLQCQSTD